MNKKELAAYWATYRKAHKKEIAASTTIYRENHKKELAAYRETHKKETMAYYKLRKSTEAIIIAQRWDDEVPRCRADLTPGLLEIPCKGRLQIDHINGGGKKEGQPSYRTQGVINGTRELDDLRILCERHNFEYALRRGDTMGGFDGSDWEE